MKVRLQTLDLAHASIATAGARVSTREQRPSAEVVMRQTQRERWTRERTRAQANEIELREANHRMEEALSLTGHELRTPLAALKGSVQLAARRVQRSARRVEAGRERDVQALDATDAMLSSMLRQIDRLTRLVNELSDASRIQAGKLDLALTPADVVEIVRGAILAQRLAWPARGIHYVPPVGLSVPVLVDPLRIEQVLVNYLTNALKYSPGDRPVAVWLEVGERAVRVCVRDDGPGVPASEHERIWERFHQVDGIAQRDTGSGAGVGLGLGLYLCRTIIERHHGRVGLESHPGQGATFWFELPLRYSIFGKSSRD